MLEDQRAAMDWEWRVVASDRHRRRALESTRRQRRLRLLVAGLALLLVVASAVLAATALSFPAPYARAAVATVAGDAIGAVSAQAQKTENELVADVPGAGGAATWRGGRSGAFSYILDGALISSGTVSLTDVSLLDGRVTAASVDLVANAAATRDAVSGGVDVSRVDGLQVDGRDVALSELPLSIDGVGVLSALERREAGGKGALEVGVTGLRLQLSDAWRELPAGAEIIVGVAAASADRETAAELLPKPAAADDEDDGAASGSSDASSGGSSDDAGASGDGSSGEGSATSGDSSAAGSPEPGPMLAPGKVSGKLLSFADAVFPVAGKVWYTDDFAVVRASGIRHGACDIFARKGTPVLAVQAGVVTEIRYRSLGGNSFHLTNDRGAYFYYAHLLRYAGGMVEGTSVVAGQLLGYVGNTGNAITTPPHLHFEIHPGGGGPVNPFPYLELWRGAEIGDPLPEAMAGSEDEYGSSAATEPSWAASQARHERAVTRAGAAPRLPASPGGGSDLVPAALSFGVLGGLVTSFVRRRRTELWLLSIDPDDLWRCTERVAR